MSAKRFILCPKFDVQKQLYNWIGGVVYKETPDKIIIEYNLRSREAREKVFLKLHDHFES